MKKYLALIILMVSLHVHAAQGGDFGQARWIGATVDPNDSLAGRSIVISKSFACPKVVASAQLRICGLGFYELHLNGSKVGDDIMSPAWSNYNKTVFYNTIDLTRLLRKRNQIDVLLGNGFYHERGERYHKLKTNFGPLTLLFHLIILYKNGTSLHIDSDPSWTWRRSRITFNSIYGGEDFDATWTDGRHPVVIQPAPKGMLREQLSEPVKIMERYDVKRRLPHHVYDMGQNLSGFPAIRVTGKRGQQITIRVGETLTDDGDVNQRQTGKDHLYRYTLAGTGIESWHPRFSYYGFRYIQIKGAVLQGEPNPDHLPVIRSLQSCFVYNSAQKIGSFECSNQRFNKTYQIIDRAIRSNWQSVWTDCPHREKLGWLEQDWLNGVGLVYNYDCRKMIEQTMQQIADAQHADGSMPEIAPEYIRFDGSWAPPFQESPEWGGALVALPALYAQHYGDSSLIRKYLPAMVRYVNYLATRDSCGILKMGLGDWYDYGPGKAGFAKNTPVALVATAHYYRWTRMVASFDPRLSYLHQRADSIKAAFLRTFELQSQAAYALAIENGLYREGERQSLMERLIDDIHRHGDRLTTGDVGTPYLFKVLVDNGQADLLYTMLNHDDVPGYGNQIKQGVTTLTEQWDPKFGASRNHFMLGHINNHLIRDIVGIRVKGNQCTIAPHPVGDLQWATGQTETTLGTVRCSWKRTGQTLSVNIELPKDSGQTAVIFPNGKTCQVDGGGTFHLEEVL